jgi:hypothetical protein
VSTWAGETEPANARRQTSRRQPRLLVPVRQFKVFAFLSPMRPPGAPLPKFVIPCSTL